MQSVYKKLQGNKNARIIRNLCLIRNNLEKNYIMVADRLKSGFGNIDTMPEYVSVSAVHQLLTDGVSLVKSHHDIDTYIITINKEISNRIANVKNVFPEWINWNYVKKLFLMPNGFTKEGIKEEGSFYNSNKNRYPYQVYMNWSMENAGNILYCDEKFVKLLYEANEDYFTDNSLVRNAGDLTVSDINEFLEAAKTAIFVVDCENSNPVKLSSVLGGLTDEQKGRIKDVLLFDSHYTGEGWGILSENQEEDQENRAGISVEENMFDWESLATTAGIKMTRRLFDFVSIYSESNKDTNSKEWSCC